MSYKTVASVVIAVLGAAGTAVVAVTAPASAAAPPRYCYSASNRVTVTTVTEVADDTYGVAYESAALWVASSPCRDINARSVRNASGPAAGQPVCVPLQVSAVGAMVPPGWIDTCQGWRVLASAAAEGRPFVVRSALRPVTVTIAS